MAGAPGQVMGLGSPQRQYVSTHLRPYFSTHSYVHSTGRTLKRTYCPPSRRYRCLHTERQSVRELSIKFKFIQQTQANAGKRRRQAREPPPTERELLHSIRYEGKNAFCFSTLCAEIGLQPRPVRHGCAHGLASAVAAHVKPVPPHGVARAPWPEISDERRITVNVPVVRHCPASIVGRRNSGAGSSAWLKCKAGVPRQLRAFAGSKGCNTAPTHSRAPVACKLGCIVGRGIAHSDCAGLRRQAGGRYMHEDHRGHAGEGAVDGRRWHQSLPRPGPRRCRCGVLAGPVCHEANSEEVAGVAARGPAARSPERTSARARGGCKTAIQL